ncbi:unnamed protein product [Mytilus edulis]|uniref:Uncharacterized protein n=1 Tax=Mytilus edulis TaxID=6550 RepID=A0A8S3SZ80_MYTED|nr:unnamed protein product [Mytilus edulis]
MAHLDLPNVTVVISSCRNDICFTWKVNVRTLTLICKVDNLHLSIFIGDPTGKLQADCLPPSQPNNCEPYYKNSSVIQYRSTNETVFQVNGKIDYTVNGNWTCRHGTRKEIASVEVSVLTIKGENNETAKDKLCRTDMVNKFIMRVIRNQTKLSGVYNVHHHMKQTSES